MTSHRIWFIAFWMSAILLVSLSTVLADDAGTVTTCPTESGVTCLSGELTATELRALDAAIAAYPEPRVTPLTVDESLLGNRHYQRVLEQVTIYDAPNGNPIGTLDPGFNFFTTIDQEGDWSEVNPGEWVESQYLGSANVSHFTGVTIDSPPVYPFAWYLMDTKPSERPGAEPAPGTDYVPHYTIVNIYGYTLVDGWKWYLVGPDQWVHQTRLGQITPVARPEGVEGRWIAIDLYEQTLIAYEDDTPVYATLVSSGLDSSPTREGLFQIWDRHMQVPMSGAEGAPDFYYLEEVPWTMYFDDEIGLHGTYWHDHFGYRHSHGCVNLTIMDSYWLYQWTGDGYEDAYVFVHSSGEYQ